MKEMTLAATVENIAAVTDFVNEQLGRHACPMKAQAQIDIAIDELFGNVARYAYQDEVGEATVCVDFTEEPMKVVITFIDQGIPYDPLSAQSPDVALSAEERESGGLGIFITKKIMDEIAYRYEDGKNVLTIRKKIGV